MTKARADAWTTIDVRDGEKGLLVIDATCKRRVQARTQTGGTGPDEVLFLTRERCRRITHINWITICPMRTPMCCRRKSPEWPWRPTASKSARREPGRSAWATIRSGIGDRGIITRTCRPLAAWFLNQETRRGKKYRLPRWDDSANPAVDRRANRRLPEDEPDRIALLMAAPAGCGETSKHAFTAIVRVTSCLL